ncbi:4a-hydroxytetrahydrobiopterin dehydratase [Novipirellula sp. SH528]|uniref:4a-hydroxytetrahydrobiopterin dehydratase n=1 Tax=Novipirellula sp. SH528 TaxID=3454466 RepID=UPI003FA028E5
MTTSKSNPTDASGSDSRENADSLRAAKCVPCEGGVPTLSREEATELLKAIPEWELASDAKRISRTLKCRNFVDAVARINQISVLAEEQQHHPDLHLTGYRMLAIELTTHAIDGLSRNDFVVAAKIDPLLVKQPK